jgi:hypothetical protein
MKKVFTLALMLFIVGCSTNAEIVKREQNTGYFPSDVQAVVSISKDIDLDKHKSLILIPRKKDQTKVDTVYKEWESDEAFLYGMLKNIGYFNKIVDHNELERIIVTNNLGEQVPSIEDRVGLHNATIAYQPFLWLHWGNTGGHDNDKPIELILTNPVTNEDLFIAQTYWNDWDGVNDQNNWYPMINALIDYIDKNSKTFSHHQVPTISHSK